MKERARRIGTGLPAGSISSTHSSSLTDGWRLCSTAPGIASDPSMLDAVECEWAPATVPGTVAQSVGGSDMDAHVDYDTLDWWYMCEPSVPPDTSGRTVLRFDGLATFAEVWFNGHKVLTSENMFLAYEVDISDLVQEQNALVIVFRSLTHVLRERRARPRWKTNLVDQQQLRWIRTTLLGRIPGWTPAIPPVGPWRRVSIESSSGIDLETLHMHSRLAAGQGIVSVSASVNLPDADAVLERAVLRVGGVESSLEVQFTGDSWIAEGVVEVPDPELWWPSTHGRPVLHDANIELATSIGTAVVECPPIGFRSLTVDRSDDAVRFIINGTPVFCRGACWTNNDVVSLRGDRAAMLEKLRLMAEGNANMIRVGGTMVYEDDDFYEACDRLGLMVWQDFMFANMDYPADDPRFRATVEHEAEQQLDRLGRHPSVVAFCGGSEVQQQAAMFGTSQGVWSNELFDEVLPELVTSRCPGVPYWPSTPTGGVLPFHVSKGLSHYYGVGAYKRPLEDVRLAGVRFTPECLGFSNVPEPDNLRALGAHAASTPHHPRWKAGVPRDASAGWDFEDIRDHYLRTLYQLDPVALRSEDPARYMRLSRVVTGRVMASTFSEWRAEDNPCSGAIVWFMNDLRPGAGWGILDSDGLPKPVYHFLKRVWSPLAVCVLDRGLDGARVDLHNEGVDAVEGELTVRLISSTHTVVTEATVAATVPSRGVSSLNVEGVVGRFVDPTYSYRFGPRSHVAIQAVFAPTGSDQAVSTFFWPSLAAAPLATEISGDFNTDGIGSIETTGLATDVRLELKGRVPDINYVDLAPGDVLQFNSREVGPPTAKPRGFVEARNAPDGSRLGSKPRAI